MTELEVQSLKIFVDRAWQVNNSSIYQSLGKVNLEVLVTYHEKDSGKVQFSGYSKEELVYLVTLLRPYISEKDTVFIPKIHNILWRGVNSKSDQLLTVLTSGRAGYDEILRRSAVKLIVNCKHYSTEDIVDLYFYGSIFHPDKDKYWKFAELMNSPATSFIEFEFQRAMIDLARLVIYLGETIRTEVLEPR